MRLSTGKAEAEAEVEVGGSGSGKLLECFGFGQRLILPPLKGGEGYLTALA